MTMDTNVSSRINLLRLMLILGIVIVHMPYGPQTTPFIGDNGVADWLRVFFAESVFRVGVPCLSAISGYLMFRKGLSGFDYSRTLGRKMQSVFLPFLIWNGAFFALVFAAQSVGVGQGFLPDLPEANLSQILNLLFALNGEPINLPLYFLRDLFVCIVLSPVLAFFIKRYPVMTLILLLAFIFVPYPIYIVLRKSILFSFAIGMALAIHKVDLKKLDPYAVPIVAVFGVSNVALAATLYRYGPDYPMWLMSVRKLFIVIGIPGFWALSALFIRSSLGQRLSQTKGLSFWIFCTHYPLLLLFWMIWNKSHASDYMIFYLTALAATCAVLLLSNEIARRVFPGTYAMLVGARG